MGLLLDGHQLAILEDRALVLLHEELLVQQELDYESVPYSLFQLPQLVVQVFGTPLQLLHAVSHVLDSPLTEWWLRYTAGVLIDCWVKHIHSYLVRSITSHRRHPSAPNSYCLTNGLPSRS